METVLAAAQLGYSKSNVLDGLLKLTSVVEDMRYVPKLAKSVHEIYG